MRRVRMVEEFPDVAVVPGADDFVIPGWTDRRR